MHNVTHGYTQSYEYTHPHTDTQLHQYDAKQNYGSKNL